MRSVWCMKRAMTTAILSAAICATGGCPQNEERTLPDESGDFTVGSSAPRHLEGTQPVSPQIGGTRWTFVEAGCTEGTPNTQGMERQLAIRADDDGLVLIYDHRIGETCTETIAQRAIPGTGPNDEWSMSEESRITLGECPTRPEDDRPGDLRMRGQFLEVYVQRSSWCNGLEVKMVYAPAPPTSEPEGTQLLRHYATHFNRRDARAVTELFADAGSLVEPFNRTAEDQPMRHDGRQSIYGWFQDAFENTPWLALKVVDIRPGQISGSYVMDWHYMDPRLDAPFGGRNRFTIAAGEIFEASIEITQQAIAVEGLEDSDQPSEAAPDTATVPEETEDAEASDES